MSPMSRLAFELDGLGTSDPVTVGTWPPSGEVAAQARSAMRPDCRGASQGLRRQRTSGCRGLEASLTARVANLSLDALELNVRKR